MAKDKVKDTITLTDAKGNKYRLGFTKRTIKMMEARGFDITQAGRTLAATEDLLVGAFLAHEDTLRGKEIEALLDDVKDKAGLAGELIRMYINHYEEFFGDKEGDDESKNVSWG